MSGKTRDVAGVLHFLTPQQMAEEIVRLDAVIADRAGPLALMQDAFDLLESDLGDSEVEYEDAEEERQYAPVQVAARYLMAAMQYMNGDKAAILRATKDASHG